MFCHLAAETSSLEKKLFNCETGKSYHFFRASQQNCNLKFYLWTQYDFRVNRWDWHILAGNEERTAWDCQNRLLHFLLHSDRSIFIFDKYWIDIESIDFPPPLLICRTLLISSRNWLSKMYNYRPRRSCEGYVFTPVCLSTGRSASVHAGIPPPPEQTPPEQTLPDQAPAPRADGYCCGRYTSYWNAFLFRIMYIFALLDLVSCIKVLSVFTFRHNLFHWISQN